MKTSGGYLLRLLQNKGVISREAVSNIEDCLKLESGKRQEDAVPDILEMLVEKGFATRKPILTALANEFQMETVEENDLIASAEVWEIVGKDLAERYRVFPLSCRGGRLQLAVANPFDLAALDDLGHLLGMAVEAKLAWPGDLRRALVAQLGQGGFLDPDGQYIQFPRQPLVVSEPKPDFDGYEAPIGSYVRWLIAKALEMRASDIHLEPLESRFRVRFRIDGSLREMENPPKRLQPAIISRLKLMAEISIAEKRLPQDGRILVSLEGREIDLRVSTLPTAHGESMVIRILDRENLRLDLSELGFRCEDLKKVEHLLSLPDGMILVTGPTGSGKTTTLYSFLHSINQPDRKIITVEDPVEYQLSGINQVQVKREVGLDFSSALRSLLRQAPNIIMIGEIRDLETAEIAVNASLTGHLVFSTLHTNDSAAAVSRLIDIGIKPFLVSASLRAVLAQRLVRLLCPNCRKPVQPENQPPGIEGAADIPFTLGTGCSQCSGRGYNGRSGIFEFMEITEEIQQLIYREAPLASIRIACRRAGLRTVWEEGMRKATQGLTTVEEVLALTVDGGEEDR